jgi:Uma2 family endonuclease
MTIAVAKYTLEQYHQIIKSGVLVDQALVDQRMELLNGEIVEMPSEGMEHAQGSSDTRDWLHDRLLGRAIVRDAKPITLPEQNSEPEPDIAIVQPLRQRYKTQHHPYPENIYLLIEYADTSLTKDKTLKRQLYATASILEYWIVNLKDRQLIVHRDPQGDDYQSVQTLTSGTINLLAFPDIAIDVTQLL